MHGGLTVVWMDQLASNCAHERNECSPQGQEELASARGRKPAGTFVEAAKADREPQRNLRNRIMPRTRLARTTRHGACSRPAQAQQ